MVLTLSILHQLTRVGNDVVLAIWSSQGAAEEANFWVMLYGVRKAVLFGFFFFVAVKSCLRPPSLPCSTSQLIAVAMGVSRVLFDFVFAYTSVRAARKIHESAFRSILRAPMNFFDVSGLIW